MAEWKQVVGFEGMYEVSSDGQIKSLFRGANRQMKTILDLKGYVSVRLCGPKRSFLKRKRVHTLVLEAFVGPRPNGMQCRHLNGDKTDNRVENLAWGTPKENALDSVKHGVFSRDAYKESMGKARAAIKSLGAKRAIAGGKWFCPLGHEIAGDNLYVRPSGKASCRECQRGFNRKFKAKKRSLQASATGHANR